MKRNTTANLIRFLDILSVAALLFLLGSGLYLFLTKPPSHWVDLIYDDAYYYLGIVKGLIEGRGSSFLPPFETNGYQPLWLILLWLSGAIFGDGDLSLAIQIHTLAFVSTILFAVVSRKQYGYAFPAVICAIAFNAVMLQGMETTLIPVLLIGYLNSSRWQMRGIFGTLLFLARLDALSIIAAKEIYNLLTREKIDFKPFLIIIPSIVAYAVFNYLYFGTPVPVSGLSKAVGNVTGENLRNALTYLRQSKVPVLLFSAVMLYRFATSAGFSLKYKRELSILLMSFLCCATYYTLKSGWPVVWGWYFWPAFLLSYYLSLELVDLVVTQPLSGKRFAWAALPLVAAIFVYCLVLPLNRISGRAQQLAHDQPPVTSFATKNLELVKFIHAHFPKGTYLAMGDRAGSFGYFLGKDYKFFHTEGLVGPFAYFKAMQKDQGEAFFSEQKVDYLVVEREQYLEDDLVIGVAEPIQGLSSHVGPYMLCFNKAGIVLDQSYATNKRYVISSRHRMACPKSMVDRFQALRDQYGGVHDFALPVEVKTTAIRLPWNRP